MKVFQKRWWKVLAIILMLFTFIGGFLAPIPDVGALDESIRNLFFHVCMWFAMTIVLIVSMVYAIRYLRTNDLTYDMLSSNYAYLGILFGVLGCMTGSFWARFSWGAWWVNDVKLNMAAITLLIYLAYLVLRSSVEDLQSRARISSVFNIFAFAAMVPLLFVVPRLTDSLHPGSGGNTQFAAYDLDNTLRMVFYPAILGWTLLGIWVMSIRARVQHIQLKKNGLA